MRKVAVIMGAGASKPFGYLLTNEIFPHIQEELNTGKLFKDDVTDNSEESNRIRRKELKSYLHSLLPGSKLANLRLPHWIKRKDFRPPLITDILSIIDHSLLTSNSTLSWRNINSQFPKAEKTVNSLLEFRMLLERAIISALDTPILESNASRARLSAFANWVNKEAKKENQSLGIISTNYDTALESKLFDLDRENVSKHFDFGFSWRAVSKDKIHERPADPLYRFYKLHGSLNWLRCELCERIYINRSYSITPQAFRDRVDGENTCYCGHARLRAVIVAPSLVRDMRDANLLEVWKHALELLRTANEWIIIGYSFPPEDIAIRSLFIRAYQGRWQWLPQKNRWQWNKLDVRVIQKGESPDTFSRYKFFFPDCVYETGGLEEFLAQEKRKG
jgi:hypothetical protein